MNAVTEKRATIQNKITKDTRNELVEPLANYNVLVLDQRLQKILHFICKYECNAKRKF
jgi:hypothetical protein